LPGAEFVQLSVAWVEHPADVVTAVDSEGHGGGVGRVDWWVGLWSGDSIDGDCGPYGCWVCGYGDWLEIVGILRCWCWYVSLLRVC